MRDVVDGEGSAMVRRVERRMERASALARALLLLLACHAARGRMLSATMRWERVGATPQELVPPSCMDIQLGPSGGCSTYNHRRLLHTVEAVFNVSAFSSTPSPGSLAQTNQAAQFCWMDGTQPKKCENMQFKILSVRSYGNAVLVYTIYQKVVQHSGASWNSTVSFEGNGLKRYAQCTQTGYYMDYACLAPDLGSSELTCKFCLDNFAASDIYLSSLVIFADFCSSPNSTCSSCSPTGTLPSTGGCLNPWEQTFEKTYQLYPVTNHHSPAITMLPIVTIPILVNQNSTTTIEVPAVDVDGRGRPLTCSSTSPCNNVQMKWDMKGCPPCPTGTRGTGSCPACTATSYPPGWNADYILTLHSDALRDSTTTLTASDTLSEWKLSSRDDGDGGGINVEVRGVMLVTTNVRTPNMMVFYPVRFLVSDPFNVSVPIEFMISLCPSIVPYTLDSQGISVSTATSTKVLAPVFVSYNNSRLSPPVKKVTCVANEPCSFVVTAVPFTVSDTSFPCLWSSTVATSRCDQKINTDGNIEYDLEHASVQGCFRKTTGSSFDLKCHSFNESTVAAGVKALTVSVFGQRTSMAGPSEFDIGRKLSLCFQARCSTCRSSCYSLPHCVVVEIVGHFPRFTIPEDASGCFFKTFQTLDNVLQGVPDVSTLRSTCTELQACWKEEKTVLLSSSSLGNDDGNSSLYGAAAAAEFQFEAFDDDRGETVELQVLNDTNRSNVYFLDDSVHSISLYTHHPSSSCDRRPSSLLHVYDETCRTALVYLNVSEGLPGEYFYSQFISPRVACLLATDNQAVYRGRGLNNTSLRCHSINFQGPPVFLRHSSNLLDSPFPAQDLNMMGNGTSLFSAYVGRQVAFSMRARDPNSGDDVEIVTLEDPGLPTASQLTPSSCVSITTPSGQNVSGGPGSCVEAVRQLRWTPMGGEDGRVYRFCFLAKDSSSICLQTFPHLLSSPSRLATSRGFYGLPHCVKVEVQPAIVSWSNETIASSQGTVVAAHVGCQERYYFFASSDHYLVEILPSSSTPLLDGMTLLSSSSLLSTATQTVLQWSPPIGTEGSVTRMCMVLRARGFGGGAFGDPQTIYAGGGGGGERCLVIHVQRCKYCIATGETLLSQMRFFLPGMNWLRLWAVNGNEDGDPRTPTIEDPFFVATDGNSTVLNVGMIYRTKKGETLLDVSSRFHTNLVSLLQLNPDLDTSNFSLPAGQEVCVIPCS
ncbi:hypothetical protein GUITHDRAFT_116645 [Guillardia theta CCMP2712]|uniref:LysM domain-containing protein n=1 Tax=Guillardia theta (strain CCMP2712) TaxID=905079 RepID=L1IMW1_GUITC|nr:hypothetical protein GUITHDRAFT_116645 [Guillardia theta CCMP2712]EKX37229.1 hypothetical protein GUITHDRAFT_116645 [Guillardia theta CCMP2712]|eukprot:XP_005824209.1 hypothetical protein GUITHDRAFT_116645 [Guillardia theta CCMP2712]